MPDQKNTLDQVVRWLAILLVGVLAVACCESVCADESISFAPVTIQTTFFSDDEIAFELQLNSDKAVNGKVTWGLTALHRTLGRGDVEIKIDKGNPAAIKLRLKMPHVRSGVIENVLLSASFHSDNNDQPWASYRRDFWVYNSDPFVDRKQWLEELELRLFDPSGRLAKIFDDTEIPFEGIRTIADLESIESGLVIVGEGAKRDTVGQTLFTMAAAGHRILWFAPEKGEIGVPGSENFVGKRPKEFSLAGPNHLETLDKRLDRNAWADAEQTKSIGLKLIGHRNRSIIEIGQRDEGWLWCQTKYSDPDGQLILCGLGLVDGWDASPTPRYMLARLMEQLDRNDSPTELTEN